MRTYVIRLTSFLFLVFALPAAADYYVSANGNDSTGDGTVANPYKSIAKALDMVGADTCRICVMTDLVEPAFSKKFTGNVTITSDDGDPATVGEKFTVYAGSAVQKCWRFRACTVSLENIIFDGRVGGPAGTTKAEGAFYGDRDTTQAKGATLNLRNGLTVQNFRAAADTTNGGNCILNVQDYSTLNIEDGVLITDNIVDEGRTSYTTNPNSIVCAGGNSTLYIKGGKITGNTTAGPATAMVYLGKNIKAYISGGEIFGNTMYATDSYALFKRMSSATTAVASDYYFQGSPRVFDNYDTNGNQKNFHRPDNTYLHLDEALTADAKIGISSVSTPTAGGVVADGQSGYTVTASDANQLFDDRNTLKIVKHATDNQLVFDTAVTAVTLTLDTLTTMSLSATFGQDIGATANDITVLKDGVKMEGGYTATVAGTTLSIAFDPALPEKVTIGVAVSKNGYKVNNGQVTYVGLHKHCICGDGACTAAGHTHTVLDWKPWTSTTSLPTTADNWYLVNDVALTATYAAVNGVNLCLNGHVVKGNGSFTLVSLDSGAAFTLTDCDQTAKHNFSVDVNGCWILTDAVKTVDFENLEARPAEGAVVALTGGALTGGYINNFGTGGVLVNGVFTMYGGALVGNRNMLKHGGAIYIGQNSSYSVTLAGGHICGNYAVGCGGAIQQDGGCVSNLRLCGADVSFNAAGNKGGAINSDSAVTVTGGRIAYNKATGLGSAMSLTASSASVSMTGGSITHNESSEAGSCGAVYFAGTSSYVIGGTLLLDENYTAGNERNLYLASGKTVTVSTTTPLATGAQIGVTTEVKPSTTAQLVPVTSNRGEDLAYFASDEGHLVVNEAGKVQLKFALNVAFHANHADVTRDGAAFSSTNAVITYGSTDGIPTLECEGLVMVGWAKTAGATEPEYTDAQVATISTVSGSSHTLYAVWYADVRIPVFVALDGFSTVPQDGRTYEVSITNGNVATPLQPCCTNLVLACPAGTGDVYRVGFATNDVTNPWTLALGNGTYIYDIRHKTKARPGEKIKSGIWRTTFAVDMTARPYVKITNDEYFEDIDELSSGSFKVCIAWGLASFSSEGRYLILGDDNQKNISKDAANRALVKSSFAFDFTRNFYIDGKINIGNAADGSAIGFVPNGTEHTKSDFSGPGSDLGVYGVSKNGKGLFLELDAYGDAKSGVYSGAHLSLTTTDANGNYTHCPNQYATFSGNYTFPTETLNYSITYDCKTKKMVFKISSATKTWTFSYSNPTNLFGSTKAYMILSGNLRYGGGYGASPVGAAAPKTKITIANFTYMDEMIAGTVDNTFRNRQEALVKYNAWGGAFSDGEETWGLYAKNAVTSFPTNNPTRTGYDFSDWYVSWTNGAAQATDGLLDPIADREVYAKWISKSVPEDTGTNTLGYVTIGDGAVLTGAVQKITGTDLAIPEFTDNGTDGGIPYVIVKDHAFAYANYDGRRVEESRAACTNGRPSWTDQHTNCLSSVVISTYVTNIQSYAFAECEVLTNVTFSQTRDYLTGEKTKLVIGDWAFANSAVSSVVFPADTCIELDVGAFADAPNLQDICILGDVSVKGKYPFARAGRDLYHRTGRTAKVHLSAKLAASPEYVLALTNGMSAVTVVLDQKIEGGDRTGSVVIKSGPTVIGDQVTFTFMVSSTSNWLKVTEDTVYLFWSTTLTDQKFIGNEPKHPTTLSGPDANGVYTATFAKPATTGSTAAYFQLAIGDPR